MNSTIKTLAIALAMGLFVSGAFAAATATDTAANYSSLSPAWSASTTPNLGSGFGAWNVQAVNNDNPPYSGTYLDETSYGNSDGVLSAGYAWGTYANSATTLIPSLVMNRPFLAGPSGSTSLFNQTFSIGIGSSGIGGTGSAISLAIGSAFLLSYAGGGSDNFTLSVDGGTATAIPVNFADLNAGLGIVLYVSGPLNSTSESYALALGPFPFTSIIQPGAYYTTSGTFDSSAYNTSSFTFTDLNTSANAYVNNPNISPEGVPEPSGMVLFGLSGLATLLAVLRRK